MLNNNKLLCAFDIYTYIFPFPIVFFMTKVSLFNYLLTLYCVSGILNANMRISISSQFTRFTMFDTSQDMTKIFASAVNWLFWNGSVQMCQKQKFNYEKKVKYNESFWQRHYLSLCAYLHYEWNKNVEWNDFIVLLLQIISKKWPH